MRRSYVYLLILAGDNNRRLFPLDWNNLPAQTIGFNHDGKTLTQLTVEYYLSCGICPENIIVMVADIHEHTLMVADLAHYGIVPSNVIVVDGYSEEKAIACGWKKLEWGASLIAVSPMRTIESNIIGTPPPEYYMIAKGMGSFDLRTYKGMHARFASDDDKNAMLGGGEKSIEFCKNSLFFADKSIRLVAHHIEDEAVAFVRRNDAVFCLVSKLDESPARHIAKLYELLDSPELVGCEIKTYELAGHNNKIDTIGFPIRSVWGGFVEVNGHRVVIKLCDDGVIEANVGGF